MKITPILWMLGAVLASPLVATAQNNPAAPAKTDAAAPSASGIIPLIVMDDVPLVDAIKNLARQANLNYMLDPKLDLAQLGGDSKKGVSLRLENITAEQALAALLGNYGLQIVEDIKTKIARVTLKDPAALEPISTRIIQLKYSSPSNILGSLQTALADKRSRVVPDNRTSQLVVIATDKELEAIEKMVDRLDTRTKQVLIEARLLETSLNPSSIRGLDWSGTLKAQNLTMGNNLQNNATDKSVNNTLAESSPKMLVDTVKGFNPATAFLNADGVNAVFSFLNQNSESKTLSTPRTVTMDNETARLSVTREIPIFNTTPSSANTPGSSSITYSNVGVILDVTPRISANNYVNLKVLPEVSRVSGQDKQTIDGKSYTANIFSVNRMQTAVMIPSGNTLVLGGLAQDDVRHDTTKVPLLGDIPGLGYLFRSSSKSQSKNNLLVFITPTIVDDTDFQETKTKFMKTPVAHDHDVAPEESFLDKQEPHDWSKLGSNKNKTKVTSED